MDPVIELQGITVRYGSAWRRRRPAVVAIDGVDLRVDAPGRVLGLLGPNGSGKTTLLRVLAGLIRPDAGRARVLGLPPDDRSLLRRVGFMPEDSLPLPQLTGHELLGFVGARLGLPPAGVRARAAYLLEQLGLVDAAHRAHGTYSTGMSRRLSLAAALLAGPQLLLLDEPTAGLDPHGSRHVVELLAGLAGDGKTVLLASHRLDEVEELCDTVVLLHDGRTRAAGTLDELLGTEEQSLVLRGLDGAGIDEVCTAVCARGGEVVARGQRRRHLYELFRDLEAT